MSADHDREILALRFATRVKLAKMTKEEVIADAVREWEDTQAWVISHSMQEQSFRWFCDEFDLDVGAVRRAIKERVK